MDEVASRELRNQTAALLRRAETGERIVITSRGRPVATLSPYEEPRRRWISSVELARRLHTVQSDAGLRADLAELAGETTDELDLR